MSDAINHRKEQEDNPWSEVSNLDRIKAREKETDRERGRENSRASHELGQVSWIVWLTEAG